MKLRFTCAALSLLCWMLPTAWGETPSIETGCAGALTVPMTNTAIPYLRAVAALKGSEVGWCAIATESNYGSPEEISFWEFSSAAYVLHALRGRNSLTSVQQSAIRELFVQIPGLVTTPTILRDINKTLYVHMRTLAAQDSTRTLVALDAIKQHSPAVYRTLLRRSSRWGDADDN